MPISTTCPTCRALFRLPEELAGKKVKCQKCLSLFIVPAADSDALAPGAPVPSDEERTNPAVESPPDKAALTHPEDIPVTARFADEDPRNDADHQPDRSRPRRGERRPRRDENPQRKSAMLPVVLVLLGLGLCACIGGSVLLSVWFLTAEARPQGIAQRQPKGFRKGGGFKNGPGNFNGMGGRPANLTPTIELKFGEDGSVRVDTELTLQDEFNPDGKRHKHYAIQMEQGKRYQIDMKVPKTVVVNNKKMKQFDAYLYLIDDANKIVAENDDIEQPRADLRMHDQDSQIVFTAPRTATYKIEATFCENFDGMETGEFTLTVKRLPD